MTLVTGISCSLRNARFGAGSEKLVQEIDGLDSQEDLVAYLSDQTRIRADDFFDAGRKDSLPFDQIYRNLKKAKGDRGLSNSEAALVAGLWAARKQGAEIAHCGLSTFFPMSGGQKDIDKLRELVLASDGLLISGPVYFGDRGSLAQSFFEFLRADKECAEHVRNCVYGGIAVGAKRNGGQETTLVYQIIDATNLHMIGVGNDSGTTAQYGGTVVAGDVGTMAKDEYGLKTSIGVGRRVAQVAQLWKKGQENRMNDKVRVGVWVLQDDTHGTGVGDITKLTQDVTAERPGVEFDIQNFTKSEIVRCIACDVCPISVGPEEDYRCIIGVQSDLFKRMHAALLDVDAIVVAAYSPEDSTLIETVYQKFVERTRYIRRDNYAFSDRLVAPLVISEVNARQNLHIRMLTSFLRHNTMLHHPIIGMKWQGEILNYKEMLKNAVAFADSATTLTTGRLASSQDENAPNRYNPVGYTISLAKQQNDIETGELLKQEAIRKEASNETGRARLKA